MPDSRLPQRRLRLFLRDFRMVEAQIGLSEGHSLMQFFASRKQYLNMRGARWANTTQDIKHVVLKIEQILWVGAIDNDVPLSGAMSQLQPREVEIQLDGGLLVHAGLTLGEGQRLSDFLESQPQFIPVRNAQLMKSGRPPKDVNVALGDIVLNQSAVQAVWEISAQAREEEANDILG